MLTITIPASEQYDDSKGQFVTTKQQTVTLEHSLISISKWESKWKKSFLSSKGLTQEEIVDYIRCMNLTQNVDPNVFSYLPNDLYKKILDYISDPMTATTFSDDNHRPSREVITSEIIYYWMISFNIPVSFEKWHLNRLLALIRVCSLKNQTPKNMPRKEALSRQHSLNAARRAAMHTRG